MTKSMEHVKPNRYTQEVTIAGAMVSSLPKQCWTLVSTVVPHVKRKFLQPWILFLQRHGVESWYQHVEAAEHSVSTSVLDLGGAEAVPGNDAIKGFCGHTEMQFGTDIQARPGLCNEVLGPCAISTQADADVTAQCTGSMLAPLKTGISPRKCAPGPQSRRGADDGMAALCEGKNRTKVSHNVAGPVEYKKSCEVRQEFDGVPTWMC